ncbi:ABC transporter ATP-binding protein [Rhodopseudomonas palustris]|uniref:ABC transporter ATP-binding protein n=1 Tax=Rhodopseudomonas palustris TaxID=1076 RepID=A0A418V1H3_RHOPL|nr:ABC transporter ATP-binding protein [Rhodopseudomonas palustris]RJF69756.1 ABC transporter ATP-binding protein [Rhodopseudomonas palustris]
MLELRDADVFYGKAQALHRVSFAVTPGDIVALIGRNGAGKSTLLRALAGAHALSHGERRLGGEDITRLPTYVCSRRGIGLVPENRQIFSNLTAEENLRLVEVLHPRGYWTRERVYALFPRLAERRKANGVSLSGGEQQMLAIGRALLANPHYLLLDEPTEGLAPVIIDAIIAAIGEIHQQGTAVVLVEQNFKVPQMLATHFHLIDSGRLTWSGPAGQLDEARDLLIVARH